MRKYQLYYRVPGVYDWHKVSHNFFRWEAALFVWWVRHTAHDLDYLELKIVKNDIWDIRTYGPAISNE